MFKKSLVKPLFKNVKTKMLQNKMNKLHVNLKFYCRFLLCKKKIAALAMGRTVAEEIEENIHLISEQLIQTRALFFTNASKEEVLK